MGPQIGCNSSSEEFLLWTSVIDPALHFQFIGNSWRKLNRLPALTIRAALLQYLDIMSPPSRDLLCGISHFVQNEIEQKTIQSLVEVCS